MEISYKKDKQFGLLIIAIFFVGVLIWMFISKVDVVIKAPGNLIVSTHKKIVKTLQGGSVDKIYIKEGDFVKKNENLIKLDTKEFEYQLYSTNQTIKQINVEKRRIISELNKSIPKLNKSFFERMQFQIYFNNKQNIQSKIDKLNFQINQTQQENKALQDKINYNKKILKTYKEELKEWEKLYKKNLANKLKILDLQRKIYKLQGNIESDTVAIKKNKEKIKELSAQKQIIISEYKKKLLKILNDIEVKLPQLISKKDSLEYKIKKSYIQSPSSGIVTDLKIHSQNEIISPNQIIMYIIPKNNKYIVKARISPKDIEKVKLNQKAEIVFSSYHNPSAKPIYGKVTYISADTIRDKKNPRMEYYISYITITKDGIRAIKENHYKLIAGMPVIVFIHVKKMNIINYILTPIRQMFKGAFYAN